MRITTLGELAIDGQPVRGERLAAVVRELVEAQGRVVSTAGLVDAVWEGAPPDDATGAVQALVSRVRRLGLPVVAVAGGYRIADDDLHVDAIDVRTLVDRARSALDGGDATVARDLADQARALLPAAPELSDPTQARLLADVADVRTRAALAGAGALDDADLRLLATRTPPDEPSVALLVRVLAAQGRDAEAVEVVDRLRTDLAERYGTDPSPVVTAAHLALLRGELTPVQQPVQPPVQPPAPPEPAAATPPHRRTDPFAVLPPAWRRAGTALVGREDDLHAIEADLATASLVTLVATGGAGKTRLAAEIARRTVGRGRSVRVVELASVRDPAEVLPTVIAAIGGGETSGARPDQAERRVLTPQERLWVAAQDLGGLVVVDNCEHLLDAAAGVVADLVAAMPANVTVLATSRAPLGVVGEVVHRVRALPDDDALALLEARARAGRPELGWDRAVALELCHRLDNLPLALELAAARLRAMPIQDVLDGLVDRFALLDDALRGLPERHASLWAMVDWSRELLEDDDRVLLERLAVIPAAFTAEAAAAVAGLSAATVRGGLARLVEQSLLALDDDEPPARYRMLETVREYGDARLDTAGGRGDAMAGLLRWAAPEAARLRASFVGRGQVAAFDACAREVDSFLAALRWAVEHDEEAVVVDVAATLFHFWTVRGMHVEVVAWARRVLAADRPAARRASVLYLGASSGLPPTNANRTVALGLFAAINGGATNTLRLTALGWRCVRRVLAERAGEVDPALATLGSVLPAMAASDQATMLDASRRLTEFDDPYTQAMGLFMGAAIRENQGEIGRSGPDVLEAYRLFESIGDHWGMGMAAQALGQWGTTLGDSQPEHWLALGIEHLEAVGALSDARSVQVLLHVRRALAGDAESERVLVDLLSGDHLESIDLAQAELGVAHLRNEQGRHDEAGQHARRAAELAAVVDVTVPQARVMFRVGAVVIGLRAAALGGTDPRDLEAWAQEQLALAAPDALTGSDVPVVGTFALGLAELAAVQGRPDLAREGWALGTRLGAVLGPLLWGEPGTLLGPALGPVEQREALVAPLRGQKVDAVMRRVRELAALLGAG